MQAVAFKKKTMCAYKAFKMHKIVWLSIVIANNCVAAIRVGYSTGTLLHELFYILLKLRRRNPLRSWTQVSERPTKVIGVNSKDSSSRSRRLDKILNRQSQRCRAISRKMRFQKVVPK